MTESDNTKDLHWLAFCYVSGEMSTDDVARFEERLATDQDAREAVALAVELSEAVVAHCHTDQATEKHPRAERRTPGGNPTSAARPEFRRIAIAAGVTAASLGALLVWQTALFNRKMAQRDTSAPVAQMEMDSKLVVAWTQTREELADGNDESTVDEPDDDETISQFEVSDDQNYEAPSWMMAALQDLSSTTNTSDTGRP